MFGGRLGLPELLVILIVILPIALLFRAIIRRLER